jgi:hypothetical protein
MMVRWKTFVFCIIVLSMAKKCCTQRVQQQNNPNIKHFMEQLFVKDEPQDQLFDEVDVSHRLPRAISARRPNSIGHSDSIHFPKPVRRPVQYHVEDGNNDHSSILHPRRPVQNHVEDENDDHSTIFRPRRPDQNHVEDKDEDDHSIKPRTRRPARKYPCPCPCGIHSYIACPFGCKKTNCPSCPCPCRYDLDNFCPNGCCPRDTCDNPWE